MDEAQSALRLIDSIERLTESTVEFIHSTVVPLTRRDVVKYLRDYDTRHNFSSLSSASVIEANSTVNQPKTRRFEFTETICKGPHPSERCWSKPENFKERDDFLARRRAGRLNSRPQSQSSNRAPNSQVRGMKRVTPSANMIIDSVERLLLHTSYEIISSEDTSSANAVTSSSETTVWALHDTGATHHMFNSSDLFIEGTLRPVEDSNRRLKLAGGGVTLAVKSVGKILLKAGDGTVFELTECLYVPDLSKNLIAGGLLKRRE